MMIKVSSTRAGCADDIYTILCTNCTARSRYARDLGAAAAA